MATTKSKRGGPRAGAGRPAVYQDLSKPTTIRLEATMLAALDEWAAAKGMKRQEAIRELLRRGLKLK